MASWAEGFRNNKGYIFSAPLVFFSSLILGSNWFSSIFGQYLPITTILIVGVFVFSEIYQKRRDDTQFREMIVGEKTHHAESRETLQNTKLLNESVQRIEIEIEKDHLKREEKLEKNSLLIDLINEQLIPIQVVDETIQDKKFITVFCALGGFSNNLPDHIKQLQEIDEVQYHQFRPDYRKIFEKIHFVQLTGRHPYFIIAEENIYPEKFRDMSNLSEYLMNKAKLLLDEKWNLIMEDSKTNSPRFYTNRLNKGNPLNFNILLTKVNSRDVRQRFKIQNDFHRGFTSELASLTDAHKVRNKIKENERIEIRKFILRSSIHILILKIHESDRKKILDLEQIFRKPEAEGGLGIKNFYDYHKKEREDIEKILKMKFSKEEKVKEYTTMIIKNSRRYKEDLIELRIDLSD